MGRSFACHAPYDSSGAEARALRWLVRPISLSRHGWAGPGVFDTPQAGWGRIAAQSETSRRRLMRKAGVEPAVRVFPGLRNSPAAERGQARSDEEDLPAQEARTEARTRLPGPHGFKGRSACACPQTREGAQAAHGLTRTRAHTCLPSRCFGARRTSMLSDAMERPARPGFWCCDRCAPAGRRPGSG